jgi:hypothetical protein
MLRTRQSRSRSLGCRFINFDPAARSSRSFLSLFLRSQVGGRFPLPSTSLGGAGTGTGTDRGVTDGLIAMRPGGSNLG